MLQPPRPQHSRRTLRWGAIGLAVVMAAVSWYSLRPGPDEQADTPLVASPSTRLQKAVRAAARDFGAFVADRIARDGCVTVTVHVALADSRTFDVPPKFGVGDDPATNLYWGALYGLETHLANAGGWQRCYADRGGGRSVLRRVVFRRRAESSQAWRAHGVHRPFDVYVLANAWPSERIAAAMEQPLHDALSDDAPVVLAIGGRDLAFGSGSVVVGYVGQNWMARQYRDPFKAIGGRAAPHPVGVFYLCSMSAVYLHQGVVGHGLYPVLFARAPIVPEAYLVDGILNALLAGNLDDGFLEAAALQYAKYQEQVSQEGARTVFFR